MDHLHISIYVLGLLVLLALVFDFMNGFHDAANAIATVVSTGVLKPQTAVAMSALFNFVAIFTVGLHVAATVGKGTIDPARGRPLRRVRRAGRRHRLERHHLVLRHPVLVLARADRRPGRRGGGQGAAPAR